MAEEEDAAGSAAHLGTSWAGCRNFRIQGELAMSLSVGLRGKQRYGQG